MPNCAQQAVSDWPAGHLECAVVVGCVNSCEVIVVHAALHDVDVGSPVVAHDGQPTNELRQLREQLGECWCRCDHLGRDAMDVGVVLVAVVRNGIDQRVELLLNVAVCHSYQADGAGTGQFWGHRLEVDGHEIQCFHHQ